ncbi:sporulation histidine kinase inhibitor Sda [Bacillus salipaludis]|uniref:sporulation histidine kinase inhibitor Sda n=1 Tax=Bacillus salipaludis TaxID=2547811 RepID=UPI002E237770|nr:sporulation histidine kinase inhibitor Sda [Bacillus salipaludis]
MKDTLELHPWFYVEDELLLAIYYKATEQQYGNDYIGFVFKEIQRRNLHPRNYLKRIK